MFSLLCAFRFFSFLNENALYIPFIYHKTFKSDSSCAIFLQVGVLKLSHPPTPRRRSIGADLGAATCAGRGPRINLFKLNLLIMTHIQRLRLYVCVALTPESYTKFLTSSFARPVFYCSVFSYMGHSFGHSNRNVARLRFVTIVS